MKRVEYPYMPEGRCVEFVDAQNVYILEAMNFCMNYSTDDKQPTGAVVVIKDKIIGRGANQTAFKNLKLRNLHERGWCVRKLLKIKIGEKYWLCPGCSKYSDHAEAQAIHDAKINNFDTTGADVYLWGHWWCCKPCWDKMIVAGIQNVYVLNDSSILFNRAQDDNRLGRKYFSFFLK